MGVWEGVEVEEELDLEVVVGGGGGVVVVGGGVVVVVVEDAGGVVVSVFCRGLIAKPLSAASLASMKVASVTAAADSPMARISRSLWACILKEGHWNESGGSMGDGPVETGR